MKPFNLEQARAGHPMRIRGGVHEDGSVSESHKAHFVGTFIQTRSNPVQKMVVYIDNQLGTRDYNINGTIDSGYGLGKSGTIYDLLMEE